MVIMILVYNWSIFLYRDYAFLEVVYLLHVLKYQVGYKGIRKEVRL